MGHRVGLQDRSPPGRGGRRDKGCEEVSRLRNGVSGHLPGPFQVMLIRLIKFFQSLKVQS